MKLLHRSTKASYTILILILTLNISCASTHKKVETIGKKAIGSTTKETEFEEDKNIMEDIHVAKKPTTKIRSEKIEPMTKEILEQDHSNVFKIVSKELIPVKIRKSANMARGKGSSASMGSVRLKKGEVLNLAIGKSSTSNIGAIDMGGSKSDAALPRKSHVTKVAMKTSKIKRRTSPSVSGLKAGFADDNKQFNYFLNFLDKYSKDAKHYPINISERITLKVKDKKGKSIANAKVTITADGQSVSSGTTYADGSFLFFPPKNNDGIVEFKANISYMQNNREIIIKVKGKREIEVVFEENRSISKNVPLDMLFVLDTTGSMGDEINRLKETIEIINLNLTSLTLKPKVRFGMVIYKDQGDSYITKVIPLTGDIDVFQKELSQVSAGGGGDTPEDLQSALKDSIQKIKWNNNGIRLEFVITDAPPHLDYNQQYTYKHAAKDAKSSGIKIFTVGTGGLDITGEYILRQISQYTSGKYIFLTYGEKGENTGGKPGSVSHHTGANYQTDKLEAIILRFAKEELNYLSTKKIEHKEEYFEAVKLEEEKKEKTLRELFKRAISQLVDYSSYSIAKEIPAAVISIVPTNPDMALNSEYFTEELIFSFSKNKTFKMVERKDIQDIKKELKFQLMGFVNEDEAIEVGKFLGAKMLITGKMYQTDTKYDIFLKLLLVETGEVISVTKLKIDKGLGL